MHPRTIDGVAGADSIAPPPANPRLWCHHCNTQLELLGISRWAVTKTGDFFENMVWQIWFETFQRCFLKSWKEHNWPGDIGWVCGSWEMKRYENVVQWNEANLKTWWDQGSNVVGNTVARPSNGAQEDGPRWVQDVQVELWKRRDKKCTSGGRRHRQRQWSLSRVFGADVESMRRLVDTVFTSSAAATQALEPHATAVRSMRSGASSVREPQSGPMNRDFGARNYEPRVKAWAQIRNHLVKTCKDNDARAFAGFPCVK